MEEPTNRARLLNRHATRIASLLAACLLAGCFGSTEPSTHHDASLLDRSDASSSLAACEAAWAPFQRAVREASDENGACVVDDDCVSVPVQVQCPNGAHLGTCGQVIASADRAAFEAAVAAATATVCAAGAEPSCSASPRCRAYVPRCIESKCGPGLVLPI